MTNQEMFTKVLLHIRAQGFAVFNGCCYRTPDGRSCAAGVLIKDEFYDPDFEGQTVTDPVVLQALGRSIGDFDALFLSHLQCAHDAGAEAKKADGTYGDMPSWEAAMAKIARSHNLTYTP